jgi:hypothetical protein
MAVTIISKPSTTLIISASYPMIFKMSSTVYGTAGVTQFRYRAKISGLGSIVNKYAVVEESPSYGYIDVSDVIKAALNLSENAEGTGGPLPAITTLSAQDDYTKLNFVITIYEQYYLNGVFTENQASGTTTLQTMRGFTDHASKKIIYDNWYRLNGSPDFMPYSGKSKIMYSVFTEDSTWTPSFIAPFVRVRVTFYFTYGNTVVDYWTEREVDPEAEKIAWVPLYKSGSTDQDAFTHVIITVGLASTEGGAVTVEETYQINKTVDCTEEGERVVMFQDRLWNWSFLSFPKKYSKVLNSENELAEVGAGRFRYNVKGSETWALNTDFMADDQNPLIEDLFLTEKAFFVDSDTGALEEVTVVPNSLKIQDSYSDGLHQYGISFRKSVNNFTS